MVNLAVSNKKTAPKMLALGALAVLLATTNVSAATSTASLNYTASAEGGKINIHDGSSRMTVTNSGGGPFQLIGYAKKSIVVLPDPTVHTSYARPVTEVKSSFSPAPSTYYAEAWAEYSSKDIRGTVKITD